MNANSRRSDADPIHPGTIVPWKERALPGNARIFWLTTAPNPRSPATGYDAGRRGWKVHAVEVGPGDDEAADRGLLASLCGLEPAHGWDTDLFVTDPCSRCRAAARKLGAFQLRRGRGVGDRSPATVVVVPLAIEEGG